MFFFHVRALFVVVRVAHSALCCSVAYSSTVWECVFSCCLCLPCDLNNLIFAQSRKQLTNTRACVVSKGYGGVLFFFRVENKNS